MCLNNDLNFCRQGSLETSFYFLLGRSHKEGKKIAFFLFPHCLTDLFVQNVDALVTCQQNRNVVHLTYCLFEFQAIFVSIFRLSVAMSNEFSAAKRFPSHHQRSSSTGSHGIMFGSGAPGYGPPPSSGTNAIQLFPLLMAPTYNLSILTLR